MIMFQFVLIFSTWRLKLLRGRKTDSLRLVNIIFVICSWSHCVYNLTDCHSKSNATKHINFSFFHSAKRQRLINLLSSLQSWFNYLKVTSPPFLNSTGSIGSFDCSPSDTFSNKFQAILRQVPDETLSAQNCARSALVGLIVRRALNNLGPQVRWTAINRTEVNR